MSHCRRSTALFLLLPLAVPAALAAQQQFDRTRPPAFTKPARLTLPSSRSIPMPNGIRVNLVEQHELPLVQLTIVVAGGARLDAGRPGLATFTANMLDEGAGTRDAKTLQSELAFIGATLFTSADWDRTTISLKVPVRSLEPALDILADVMLRPTFSAVDVGRQRGLRLANLLQLRDEPNALADLAFNQLVYPEAHPYHGSTGGDSSSTAALDSASVRDFYARSFTPARTTVYVVGDVTAPVIRTLLEKRFGAWRAGGGDVPTTEPPAPTRYAGRRLYLVDKPDAAQSVIAIGGPGVSRRSPDFAALQVMNTILGGSFSSRLNTNLRETKGYTYGARSGYAFRLAPGPFSATAAVRTNVTDSSLVEFFKELNAIRDTPVGAAELERAKNYIELQLPSALESTTQIAGQMATLGVYGLTLEALREFAQQIRAVTAADVQRVAKQYIPLDTATIVIVGDVAKIRTGIDALKLGTISMLDVKQVAK